MQITQVKQSHDGETKPYINIYIYIPQTCEIEKKRKKRDKRKYILEVAKSFSLRHYRWASGKKEKYKWTQTLTLGCPPPTKHEPWTPGWLWTDVTTNFERRVQNTEVCLHPKPMF